MKTYTIELNDQELGFIQIGLNELPEKIRGPIISRINQQVMSQTEPEPKMEPMPEGTKGKK